MSVPRADVQAEQSAEQAGEGPPRWLVVLLAVACGLTVANLYYAQPLLAELRRSFQVGAGTAGGLVTATQLGYAAGMLLLVPLGDRVETRRLVSALLGFTTIASLVAGLAPSFWVLAGAALVSGATSVVAQILLPFAAGLAPEARRGQIVGRVVSGLLAGILLSRTLGSWLADVAGWRAVYLVAAGLMAILAVTLRACLPRRQPTTVLSYGRLLRSTGHLVARHGPLRRRALYQAAMFGAFSAFWTTVAFVLTGPGFGYSQLGVGLFALVGAGGALVAPWAGRWADRGLVRRMSGVAFGIATGAMVLALVGRHEVVALAVAAVLLDMAVQTSFILGQHTIYQLDPAARARLNSAYLATLFCGGAVGSQAGSMLYHSGGWAAVCALGGALPLAAAAFWATERRH